MPTVDNRIPTEGTQKDILGALGDIKDAIEAGSSGSSGHIIQNPAGANLTQRNTMQFADLHVADDSTNEKTVVENIQSVSESDWENVTEDGLYDVDIEGVDIGPASDDKVEVTADGVKTYATLLNEIATKMDFSKVRDNAYLATILANGNKNISVLRANYGTSVTFFQGLSESTGARIRTYYIEDSNSQFEESTGSSYSDKSTTKPTNGTVIRLYYGNKKAVVDLQTTANRCLMSDGSTVQQALTITKSEITPNVGVTSGYTDRNIYYTDKRTFIKYSFILDSRTTAIADGTKIFDFPNDIDLSHLSVQYSIAQEIKNDKAHIVYCTNQGIYLAGNTTAQANNYLTGSIYIHLV